MRSPGHYDPDTSDVIFMRWKVRVNAGKRLSSNGERKVQKRKSGVERWTRAEVKQSHAGSRKAKARESPRRLPPTKVPRDVLLWFSLFMGERVRQVTLNNTMRSATLWVGT